MIQYETHGYTNGVEVMSRREWLGAPRVFYLRWFAGEYATVEQAREAAAHGVLVDYADACENAETVEAKP